MDLTHCNNIECDGRDKNCERDGGFVVGEPKSTICELEWDGFERRFAAGAAVSVASAGPKGKLVIRGGMPSVEASSVAPAAGATMKVPGEVQTGA